MGLCVKLYTATGKKRKIYIYDRVGKFTLQQVSNNHSQQVITLISAGERHETF